MAGMTKRQRVMAAVKGEPVDRVPVSFFMHDYRFEQSADMVAARMLEVERKFDWDFVKVQLRPSYYGEAWGCKYRWDPENPMFGYRIEDPVVKRADDFKKLKKLDPTRGVLGEQVMAAKLLGEAFAGSVPYVQTLATPLSVATRLTESVYHTVSELDIIEQVMNEDPEAMHYGLSIISQTLAEYARQVVRAGADGIFLTTTAWTADTITEESYNIFGRPYDLAIYEAAIQEGATFNILHLCRDNIMLDFMSNYPVQVISYYDQSPRNPSLREALNRTDKALWGGLNQETTLLNGPTEAIAAEVHAALEETGGKRFFLGPGCSPLSPVPDTHLLAVKEALSSWERDRK